MAEKQKGYLAFDLGAESGRAMVGLIEGGKLTLHEVHRFNHEPVHLPSGMHWNITGIWQGIVDGLREAVQWSQTHGVTIASAGVDTWGVDFGLLGASGELLGIPHNHRDPRHGEAFEKTVNALGPERLYDATGIQLMPINSLYQLVAIRDIEPAQLESAAHLLFTPDLLHYWLTGEKRIESSIASTSQMIDPRTGKWHAELLKQLNLPSHMLSEPVSAGSTIGHVRADVSELTGAPSDLPIIAPAAHDTASAVAAVPAKGDVEWAYLSSGTWSLMGAEVPEPVLSEAARESSFTNEGGVGGIRFLKNISGLWLVQQTRRYFASQGQDCDYGELMHLAEQAEPFRTLVDPDHPPFMAPGYMPRKIADYAKATGQPEPQDVGQFVRCCLESLALKYRQTLDGLEEVLGKQFDVLHVVGGGGKNELLNQMTADAIQRRVVVGPYEATATGNVMVQAMGAGDVADQAEIRRIVAASVETSPYEPKQPEQWQQAYDRFADLCKQQVQT